MPSLSDYTIDDLADVAEALRRVTVVISVEPTLRRAEPSGRGSGIIWSSDGTIVTNAHVATADRAVINLADGRRANAVVVARDRRADVALLRLDRKVITDPLPVPVLRRPATLRPGELVLALGHPFGVENALAIGVVHVAPAAQHSPYVVADIRLAPGNSGGPLADANGRVVGVNSMIVGGLGVAISTDVVRRLIARVSSTIRERPSIDRDAA